jgi:hypothetical protein
MLYKACAPWNIRIVHKNGHMVRYCSLYSLFLNEETCKGELQKQSSMCLQSLYRDCFWVMHSFISWDEGKKELALLPHCVFVGNYTLVCNYICSHIGHSLMVWVMATHTLFVSLNPTQDMDVCPQLSVRVLSCIGRGLMTG